MKPKQNNDMTNRIGAFYVENEIELLWSIGRGAVCVENQTWQWHDWLSYHDRSNRVWHVTKTKQDKDMTDRTSVVYIENETELSWYITLGAVYD